MTDLWERIVNDEDWKHDALCREHGEINWFPGQGESNEVRKAKAICAECTVREECLDYAQRHKEVFGIWGGLSERQRKYHRDRSRGGFEKPCWCGRKIVLVSEKYHRQGLTRQCGITSCRPPWLHKA